MYIPIKIIDRGNVVVRNNALCGAYLTAIHRVILDI